MKSRPLIILAVIVVAIVGTAIWFLQTQPAPAPLPTVGTTPVATPPPVAPPPMPRETAKSETVAPPTAAPKVEPAEMEEWEKKIDQALRSNAGETETAQILINMLPSLPPEGQAEAAQHIANLIQDKDFNRVMPLLRNTSLPEEVHDVFVTDLMNREDSVKLPALLEVAKLPNHPHHEEAQTDLQIFLDEDYGSNWQQWDKAIKDYLKKQAEEEAAADNPNPTAVKK